MNPNAEPALAPPGAGLPALELSVARLLFALRRRETREAATARFVQVRQAIRDLVEPCDAQIGAVRVLIQRVRGLEDSSRFWSVWMTLDHLRIVHHEIARVIKALTSGRALEGVASTAAVKPSAGATTEVRTAYEESCNHLLATAAEAGNLRTTLHFAHPWFGPLDAAGWYTLAGGHMSIHREQIARILRGTGQTRPEAS